MKKAMLLAILLPVLALGGVLSALARIMPTEDQVVYTETLLWGDREEAVGITAQLDLTLGQHLLWESTYTVGGTPEARTEFTYSDELLQGDWDRDYTGVELRSQIGGGMSASGLWEDPEDPSALTGFDRAMYELAQTVPAGEEGTALIRLQDYYDYYPLSLSLEVEGMHFYEWDFEHALEDLEKKNLGPYYREELEEKLDLYGAFADFFRLPVVDGHELEIHLTKNMSGQIRGWGYSSHVGKDSYQLYSTSEVADDAIYFALNGMTGNGEKLDFSLVPGGYGLYRLPLIPAGEDHGARPVAEELAMVYPMDQGDQVHWMQVTGDGELLLMITYEEEGFFLSVIRRSDMETLQRLRFQSGPDMAGISNIFWEEDFLLLDLYDSEGYGEDLVLFTRQEDGTFALTFTVCGDPEGAYGLQFWESTTAVDWNGEKLAVLISQETYRGWEDQEAVCGFDLAVYDQTGLLYCGRYASSLDVEPQRGRYNETCRPMDGEFLHVFWNGS